MNAETREKIFDLILTDALKASLDNDLRSLEESPEYGDYKFPADLEKNIRKIKRTAGRKERIRQGLRVFARAVVTAASVMGVVFGGLLTQPTVY
ncbi:MAG: hypothetical protein NC078_11930, partial [Ruminococcus sp.]|nr:hypothetical protein [Ruminococcus sp.]